MNLESSFVDFYSDNLLPIDLSEGANYIYYKAFETKE